MKKILLLLLCYCSVLTMMGNQLTDTITVTKIWDKEKHNGFPDLYYFNNEFYCSFREAFTHVDTLNVGKVRIIKSKDTKNWQTVALFEIPGVDVREDMFRWLLMFLSQTKKEHAFQIWRKQRSIPQ